MKLLAPLLKGRIGNSASRGTPSGCHETPHYFALLGSHIYLTAVFLWTLVAAGLAQVDRPVIVVLHHTLVDDIVSKLFFLRGLALHLKNSERSHLPTSEVVNF